MSQHRILRLVLGIGYLTLLLKPNFAHAQAGYELDLKKPPQFENKVLASEKSTTTKNTVLRRFVQGTVTHYNYYFNANQKLIEVLNKARASHQDDLTSLISFYNYSLLQTSQNELQLDSVIYKCTAGIVLHDLRNGWIDNLYLLIGQAYYFEMKFDSCDRILEFLNYHFYVKEKGDYHIPIGTREQSKDGQISIVSPENHSILHEAFNRQPSRNEGLIFQVRSYTEQGKYAQAAGLISLLKTDPLFPSRLQPALYEQEAYWFFQQEGWDSAVAYLQKALPAAGSRQELARWEYLLAQLSEKIKQPTMAVGWYDKAIAHNTDPRIDIYARLYRALLTKGTSKEELPNTIAALLRLAKKDRFAPFRDILYLAAARLALQEPDTTAAFGFLHQSVRSMGRADIKNQSYLLMADLGRARSDYKIVATSYDSLQLGDPSLAERSKELTSDKKLYDKVLYSILKVEREDSLQRIAAMPEAERTAYIKDLLRKMLRAQGIKDDNSMGSAYGLPRDSLNGGNLFGSSNAGNGEWYFYNNSTRAQGAQDFQSRFGNRPNVDNWRRQSAVTSISGVISRPTDDSKDATGKVAKPQLLTFASLLADVPLTPKSLQASNDTISSHLFQLGNLYKNEVGDYRASVRVLEELYARYPAFQTEATLFNLYYGWHQLGDEVKANYYKDLLQKRYPDGKFIQLLSGAAAKGDATKDSVAGAATEQYKQVYDQFISGNYDSAVALKKQADSIYGGRYWTPQLMYIEAVYYAHERKDSSATKILGQLVAQFPKDPLAPKAARLKDVLGRRTQIEQYLTNLHVERDKEDSLNIDTTSQAVKAPVPAPIAAGPPDLHRARENDAYPMLGVPVVGQGGLSGRPGLLVSSKPVQGLHSDSYYFDPSSPHLVLLVMTQVASVYSTEAKNAFSRYDQDVHYQEDIPLDTMLLQAGVNVIRIGPFKNIIDAIAYQMGVQRNSPKDIIPWLAASKYQFVVISLDNLTVLRQKKNLTEYSTFIESYLKNLPKVK